MQGRVRTTTQDLGDEFENLLEELLLSPVHARCWNPEPFSINTQLFEDIRRGKTVVGSALVPTTEPVAVHNSTWLDENEEPEWRFMNRHAGYWHVMSTEEIYYGPVPHTPVWTMSVYGSFQEKFVGNRELAEETFQLMARACRPVFSARRRGDRTFYPRGVHCFEQEGWRYESTWIGDHHRFSGSEVVFKDEDIVWSATYHGGTLLSV